jgi:predicted ATP-binding protein involved in virulence
MYYKKMIQIKNLTVKNFMSVGNATQAIDFDRKDLTLVLGENLDLGGDGSRNGTGKTTIINALRTDVSSGVIDLFNDISKLNYAK